MTDLASLPNLDAASLDLGRRNSSATFLLRELAGQGTLVPYAAQASRPERKSLVAAGYDIAVPVVFERLTRPLERGRGHRACATSVRQLAPDCLDRFEDDLESVVDDLLARAVKPIDNLEAWIASRLNAATVNGYRRRRGQRGALQRPRLPAWLGDALGNDRWLTTLAVAILGWVGIATTAGTGLWPLESWANQRARVTGDWLVSDQAMAAREVERVLAAMRLRPAWYERYVEVPLGRKQAPVASLPTLDRGLELALLPLTEPHEAEDTHLRELVAAAVPEIIARVRSGEDPRTTAVEVLGTAFEAGTGHQELDRPPHAAVGYEERALTLLADPAVVERVAATVLSLVDDQQSVRNALNHGASAVPAQRKPAHRPVTRSRDV